MHKHRLSVFILVCVTLFPEASIAAKPSLHHLGGSPKLTKSSISLSPVMAKNKSKNHRRKNKLNIKGGEIGENVDAQLGNVPRSQIGFLASLWGSVGVFYFLLNPMKRLLPLALLPFDSEVTEPHSLTTQGWVLYAAFVVMMAYQEGYKGFQKKFSPMVVARAYSLTDSTQNMWLLKMILAPLYSMGLIFASRKRLIVSWAMVFGVSIIVAICKHIPYPWRSVVDGGVVVGLSWGALAILLNYLKPFLTGKLPSMENYN